MQHTNNSYLAKKIFDALYDKDDIQELLDKNIISCKDGYKITCIACIELELDNAIV